tara:strand:+ start:1495 stop:1767 length:273 start_codon:yes stop_codon:yes gene_type:complete
MTLRTLIAVEWDLNHPGIAMQREFLPSLVTLPDELSLEWADLKAMEPDPDVPWDLRPDHEGAFNESVHRWLTNNFCWPSKNFAIVASGSQ